MNLVMKQMVKTGMNANHLRRNKMETHYDELKSEIQKKSKELCILIEKFDIIDNKEFNEDYK